MNVTEIRPTLPKPALTFEEMWYRLKAQIAPMVMDRKTPNEVFHIREIMGELEAERTQPWRDYIHARDVG